jgi:molybdopterin molybdotransferase
MIDYPEALGRLLAAATPLPARRLLPGNAGGLTLAAAAASPGAVPPFANAALDGYAVQSADLAAASPGEPVRLRLAGFLPAGQPAPAALAAGEAWEVMTGAPLPAGADALVAVEKTTRSGAPGAGALVQFTAPIAAGANVRRPGEDYAAGDLVLPAGAPLDAIAAMGLGATGVSRVSVRGPVRVAILTTGSEVRSPGTVLAAAEINDANGPYLQAVLASAGATCVGRAQVADDLPALQAAIASWHGRADVIVTTGGVSAGTRDLVPAAVAAAGAELLFHKVAIRPGKPLLAARFPAGPWLLGLPGNPVAVAAGARFFLVPLLRALLGRGPESWLPARVDAPVRARPGLHFFGKARARIDSEGTLRVALLPGQESFRVAPLVAANCWLILPADAPDVAAGDSVRIVPLAPDADWLGR